MQRETKDKAWEVRVQGQPCGSAPRGADRGERARRAPSGGDAAAARRRLDDSAPDAHGEAYGSPTGPSVWGGNLSRWCNVQPQNEFAPAEDTWKMYSVERFYTAPLVANVSCDARGAAVRASVWGIAKSAMRSPASYAVRDDAREDASGDGVTGAFSLEPFWLPTTLAVAARAVAPFTSGELVVTDARGRENTTVRYDCA